MQLQEIVVGLPIVTGLVSIGIWVGSLNTRVKQLESERRDNRSTTKTPRAQKRLKR